MRTRIRFAISIVALVAATALFIGTPGAGATQGQAVVAGQENTEAATTKLVNTNEIAASNCPNYTNALVVCGEYGITGYGIYGGLHGVSTDHYGIGVDGDGAQFGVEGTSAGIGVRGYGRGTGVGVGGLSADGTGMTAESQASNGVGIKATALTGGSAKAVWGVSDTGYGGYFEAPTGLGFGVYATGGTYGVRADGPVGVSGLGTKTGVRGEAGSGGTGSGIGVEGATGSGSGVYGHATSGIGVNAYANGGIALQVQGRAKFSRSGTVLVGAGTASKAVSLSGTTGNSMILAIAQQNANVFVKATVPAAGSFTIYLTGNAPAGGLKVAYFVLN
jgi:hypothetical protein